MSKVLVIVESPAKAKTIANFLGSKKYTVKSSMGHIRDLPKSQLGVDVENNFEPKYITIRGKGELLKELRSLAKKSDKVLLAPDPDREGEAIAWHLQQILGIDEQEKCRIEFNEITKKAIQEAVKKPRQIDEHRVCAQQARRILDRLVGYKLSPLLWAKVRKGLSAGRVQSVAVRLIAEREEEIQNFRPEEYWSLTAKLGNRDNEYFLAKLFKDPEGNGIQIGSEAEMNQVMENLKNASYLVTTVKKRERRRNPYPPFTTSSLQQEAYRKLGFVAKKTMRLAQQLYEGLELGKKGGTQGLITYLRTDSTRVATEAQEEARQYINEVIGAEYVPETTKQYITGQKKQDAHEAIRPTSVFRTPDSVKEYLSRDQWRLYRLIWERFVASQMKPAVIEVTTVDITANRYQFRASGSVIKFPGFLKVYGDLPEENGEESGFLPELAEGEVLQLKRLEPKQHFTQPPPRYSEATLVKTLEELGIGRPSTYAPTIDNILNRGYVVRENKQFIPTELGIIIVDLLKEFFPDVIDVEFTANMEQKLDEIEEGERDWKQVLHEFYEPFAKLLEHAEQQMGPVAIPEEETDEKCEKCGRNMVIKMGRYGKFLACPGFPDCRNTRPLLQTIGVPCPACGADVVVRRTKKGRVFYGCSKFPECDWVSWNKPTGEKCPNCGEMLVEKANRKEQKLVCSREGCGYESSARLAGQ
ncbi:MAG: type I DNA topoisomerase [Clostridia bacterium]|nr:type I DNA topoisomerase [Clostridia bacterium]